MSAITIPVPLAPAPQTPAVTPPPVGAVTPPAPQLGWQKHRWTIAEYRELDGMSVFRDRKTVLLHGEIFTMAMPDPIHDVGLTLAFRYVTAACPAGHYVRNQQGFDVGTDNDPGPDLAVVSGDVRDYLTKPPSAAVWVVEVANKTVFDDTTTKAELYATAGIPDYWVLDVTGRQLIVFRNPQPVPAGGAAYRQRQSLNPNDTVAPLAAPRVAVRVADLLP